MREEIKWQHEEIFECDRSVLFFHCGHVYLTTCICQNSCQRVNFTVCKLKINF